MERASRRGTSRTEAAKEKLAALAAARAGGKKRVDTFEVKREESVYDEARSLSLESCASSHAAPPPQLDEKQYASLVAKRRMETGGFIVGDAAGGCVRRPLGSRPLFACSLAPPPAARCCAAAHPRRVGDTHVGRRPRRRVRRGAARGRAWREANTV
jgi:hypothetical protein